MGMVMRKFILLLLCSVAFAQKPNLPNETTASGDIIFTEIATPGVNPASGKSKFFIQTSTHLPCSLDSTGTVHCVESGSGTVTNVATTSPITGGPITTTGTIACATCVTSAASLTSGQLVAGAGGQASAVTNLTGDVTTSGGVATTLASVVTASTCGDTTHSCGLTYDAKGRITAATNNVIASGSSGALTKICSLTASASASLDFTSANCGGSNVFTSTYNEYVIKITSLVLNTSTADLGMLVSTTGGSPFANSGYISATIFQNLSNGTTGTLTSTTEIQLDNSYGTSLARNALSGTIAVHDPLNAATDKAFEVDLIVPNSTPAWFRFTGGGVYDSSSAITAFQIKPSAGTLTSGAVTIYGYQK
jgi:hypothetical protein